jgi:hypothetical protein
MAMGRSSERVVRSRFEGGARCFGAWVEGRLAAYGWASAGREWIGEMGRDFHIPPGEIYIWDCLTLPEYRRNRLYSALLSSMAGGFRGEGARRIWIGSNIENRPSIRGFNNAGFRPAAEVISVRIALFRGLKSVLLAGSSPELAEATLLAFRADRDMRLGGWLLGIT